MEYITYVCLFVAALAALDRIFGNRFGLGEELEKGIETVGALTLSMAGMLVLAPFLSQLLGKLSGVFPSFLDFSIVPACFLANDMGGAHLATQLAGDAQIGAFNALIVSSMMGCTVSFTIPFALQKTPKDRHSDVIFGILCGMIAIPVGCLLSGLMCSLPVVQLLVDLIPLFLFVALIAVGILFFEKITIKIFLGFAWIIRAVITFGLFVGIVEFATGKALLPQMETLGNAMDVIINIICIMAGAFPLLSLIKKALRKVFDKLGKKLGINETAAFGLLATCGSSVNTFEIQDQMDRKGLVLNAAFAVGASFVFVDHLAFTMVFNSQYVPAMVVGKLVTGVVGVVLAFVFYNRRQKKNARLTEV